LEQPTMKNRNSALLSQDLVELLTSSGTVRKYLRGTAVFEEGDLSNTLYVLAEGQLKVYTRDERGRELVFNTIAPGEIFGELFLDGGARSASVRALIDSSCVVIDEKNLRKFMELYPEFAHYLVHKLIGHLRHSTQLSRSLALEGVYERTAMVLESVAEEDNGVRVVPASMTQQEIADRVGATREMVNHVIRELIDGGLAVRDEKRRLVLKGPLPGR
jgi:CRP/FNR family transcriptional regulator, cyclic AMP receptor protein